MDDNDSAELMCDFAERGSHDAFRALVERYLPVVYGAAFRRIGNTALAEEVTQLVFIDFAKRLPALRADNRIGAWLHRAATLKAGDVMKAEIRRKRREQIAATTQQLDRLPECDAWRELSPVLDEAISRLRQRDREAVILRFHEEKSLREVGAALGITVNAAQKRIDRALGKLRVLIEHQGASTGVVLLGSLVADGARAAAIPKGLGAKISAKSIAAVPAVGIAAWWHRQGIVTSYLFTGAALTLICGMIPLSAQWNQPRTQVRTNVAAPIVEKAAAPRSTSAKPLAALSVDEIVDELGRLLSLPLTSLTRTRCRILIQFIPSADVGAAMIAMDERWSKHAKRRANDISLRDTIARKWAEQDPPAAVNWVMRSIRKGSDEYEDRSHLQGLLERFLRSWAKQDWYAAWKWTLTGIDNGTLLSGDLPKSVTAGIEGQLMERAGFRGAVDLTTAFQSDGALSQLADEASSPGDFSYYMEVAGRLRSPAGRIRARSNMLMAFRKRDWQTVDQWVKSRPTGWERAQMGWLLGFPDTPDGQSVVPVNSFTAHANWLQSQFPNPKPKSKLAKMAQGQVVGSWMKQDPANAVGWLLSNADFPFEKFGLDSVFRKIGEYDFASSPVWQNEAAKLARRLKQSNTEAYGSLVRDVLQAKDNRYASMVGDAQQSKDDARKIVQFRSFLQAYDIEPVAEESEAK